MERPWLKFYDPHVPPNIPYPPILLPQILDDAADQFPDRPAVFFFGGRIKYGEMRAQANRFASALQEMGFRQGDRLGLLLPNMPQTMIAAFGTLKAGGVAVFFDPLADEEELERQFIEAGVETLVVLDLILPRVDKVFSKTKVRQFLIAAVKDYLPFPKDFFFSLAARVRGIHVPVARKPNIHRFKDFIQTGRPNGPAADKAAGDTGDVAFIQYTAGTSGLPKGVLLTHRNLVANILQASSWVGNLEKGKETFLSILPFHQAYGMTLAMNLPVYLAAMGVHLPRFETTQVLAAIKKHRPSFFPASPYMIEPLSTYPEIDKEKVSVVKIYGSVGQPLSEETLQNFERIMGRKIWAGYGLTEASPLSHANPVYGKRKAGSIGIPLPDTDARIVDPLNGEKEMPRGESGELIIRGPQVMKGYWNRPAETSRALRHGWLHTGDLARMDEDGYFYITGKIPKK